MGVGAAAPIEPTLSSPNAQPETLSPQTAIVADIRITRRNQNFRGTTDPIIGAKGRWLQDRRCLKRRRLLSGIPSI
jgi:hypothetical protein